MSLIKFIWPFLLLALSLFAVPTSSAESQVLAPVINLILQEDAPELTPLEKVLAAYQNPDSGHIFIAAWRGGRENDVADNAPGNSIANIDNALSNGFDLYESDIEILGDDTLVAFHDNDFDNLTNSTVENDLLDNATLDYAKSLFLTYVDGSVSNERIPTLEEFLLASKDKIMLKFDPKSGTFGGSVLRRIFDLVVANDMVEQVLIRGGQNVLDTANEGGYDTRMIMRRYNSAPSVADIQQLIENYTVRAISIPDGASDEVIAAATAAGLVVEVHELQAGDVDVDEDATEEEQQAAIEAALAQASADAIQQGVRQFHSFRPTWLKPFLSDNGHREF